MPLFLFLLVSCSGDHDSDGSITDTSNPAAPSWDTDFSAVTSDQFELVLSAGLAYCPLYASFAFIYSDMDAAITEAAPPACPTTEVEGTMVRFTGGCTATGGYTYDGVFEADNAGGLYAEYSEEHDTILRFSEYSMVDAYGAWSFDGSWTVPSASADNPTLEDVALSCDLGGGSMGVYGPLDCTVGEHGRECTLQEGMEGEVDGLGRFGMSGNFAATETGYDGVLILSGQQELVIQLSDAEGSCIPYTLDGEPGEHCRQ